MDVDELGILGECHYTVHTEREGEGEEERERERERDQVWSFSYIWYRFVVWDGSSDP
jgi:hypothetical protein